jgi:hypothetical protein
VPYEIDCTRTVRQGWHFLYETDTSPIHRGASGSFGAIAWTTMEPAGGLVYAEGCGALEVATGHFRKGGN